MCQSRLPSRGLGLVLLLPWAVASCAGPTAQGLARSPLSGVPRAGASAPAALPPQGGPARTPEAAELALEPSKAQLPLQVWGEGPHLIHGGFASAEGGAAVLLPAQPLRPGQLASRLLAPAAGDALWGLQLAAQEGKPLLANDGGSLLANDGGGLLANDGGGLLANDGGGLLANDGGGLRPPAGALLGWGLGGGWGGPRQLLATTASPSEQGRMPVAGFQVVLVNLLNHQSHLVVGPGLASLATDRQGRMKVPLPQELPPEVRNLLVLALNPKDDRIRQAMILQVQGQEGLLNESKTLLVRYLRELYTQDFGQFFAKLDPSREAKPLRWGQEALQANPVFLALLQSFTQAFRTAGLAAAKEAGQTSLSTAQGERLAAMIFDHVLATLDLDPIKPDGASVKNLDPRNLQGEAFPGIPLAQDALGLMEQAMEDLRGRTDALIAEGKLPQLLASPAYQEGVALLGRPFPIQRGQDYVDFVIRAYVLRQADWARREVGAHRSIENAFAAAGAQRSSWGRLQAGAAGFGKAAITQLLVALAGGEVQKLLDEKALLETPLLQAMVREGQDPSFRALGGVAP